MSLTKKIRGAMMFKGINIEQLAAALNVKPYTLRNKFYRHSFSIADLIGISNALGFEVCLFDGEQKIVIDKEDLVKPYKKEKPSEISY